MPIKFEILDVGHGFCAFIEAENKNLILIDCGMKSDPPFLPSSYLWSMGQRSIEYLFITNYDEDHISNLPELISNFSISIFHRNRSISRNELEMLKKENGLLSSAMISLLDMMDRYTEEVTSPPLFPGINWNWFHHAYKKDFEDTNNISHVLFFNIKGTTVLISGDLEVPGWEKHLTNPNFVSNLRKVNIFVASHHGRENGYCQEVFNHCHPNVVIISDGSKQYATQETINNYASHCSGVQFNGQLRKVLTTRKDGGVQWLF